MELSGHKPNGLGIANGTVLMALFDHMLADGTLLPHDVRTILGKAAAELEPRAGGNIGIQAAVSIIREEMLPRFEKSIQKD